MSKDKGVKMNIEINEYFSEVTIKFKGQEFWLEFGHHDVSMWSLTQTGEDVWENSLLRGRFSVNTNRTTVLKKCIDLLYKGENNA